MGTLVTEFCAECGAVAGVFDAGERQRSRYCEYCKSLDDYPEDDNDYDDNAYACHSCRSNEVIVVRTRTEEWSATAYNEGLDAEVTEGYAEYLDDDIRVQCQTCGYTLETEAVFR